MGSCRHDDEDPQSRTTTATDATPTTTTNSSPDSSCYTDSVSHQRRSATSTRVTISSCRPTHSYFPIINITQPSMVYPNISVIQNVGSPSNRLQDQNSFQSPRTPMYGDTHSVQSPSSQFANISLNSPQPLSPQFSPSPQQVSQQPNNFPSQPIQQQDIYHVTQQNYNYQIPTENTFDDIPDDILAAILPDHGMNVIVADGEKKPCASESHKKSKDKHRKSSKKKDDNILKAMDKLSLEE